MQYNFRMRLEPYLFSGHFDRRAPFWPADITQLMHKNDAKGLKLVTQPVWQVWLVEAPGQFIVHVKHDFDTISSEGFLFSPFFTYQEKSLLSE